MTTMNDIHTIGANRDDEYDRLQSLVPYAFASMMAFGPVLVLIGLALADNNVVSLGLVLMLTGCAGIAVSR